LPGSAPLKPGYDARVAGDLELIVRCLDLTTLEPDDTADTVLRLARRGVSPAPGVPSVAAVCVWGHLVPAAVEAVAGSTVRVAGVAGAFPTGDAPVAQKSEEVRRVVEGGGQEVDFVLHRGALLAGERGLVEEDLGEARRAAGPALLKVILETGQLGDEERIVEAAELAMSAGADFLKTSTGKTEPGATPEATRTVMMAVARFHARTGRRVGVKVSGGVRRTDQAVGYVALLREVLGPDWLGPEGFRVGASSLLDDVLAGLGHPQTR
jgi:deoxyribose-phosphate aldolase